VRVAVLLLVLVLVVFWGVSRQRSRLKRVEWTRPLRVAVVLLSRSPVSPPVREAWRGGLVRLGEWVAWQAGRYRTDLGQPIQFTLVGPVDEGAVRLEPTQEAWWRRALQARRLAGALARADAAAGLSPTAWDARIYVLLEEGGEEGPRQVEGLAEAGGRVGLVRGVREERELTLELTAVAHELFHCLGAADAYDAEGHALVPQGLVEPERQPLYPQPAAEVMVGEVPLRRGQGRLAQSLDEVGVGPATAHALHWTE
jgi:hypothetical protein